jgi:Clostripain family.
MAKVRLILVSLLTLLFCSCERDGLDLTLNVGPFGEESRQVLLLYEAGFNSLSSYIHQNINVLRKGYLPGKGRAEDVVLVFSHLTLYDRQSYTTETAPAMVRLYSEYGEPRADTLKVWPAGTPVANKEVMTEVFNWVREQFPAAGDGAILSSHATGYLPEGYYDNPRKYEGTGRGGSISTSAPLHSFGQEYYSAGTKTQEMELKDLAAAIPYKLDYLVFDACLMGTVEVAWALRDVCSYLAFSPCEIPAVGFDFRQIAEHLLKPEVPDVKAVCQDYYAYYEDDNTYGATITLVDCSRLDRLAATCRDLFDRYRSGIRNLSGKNVQVYDRRIGAKTYYAFFDLKDILREAGASDADLAALQSALDEAIVYEAHTPRFISVKLDRVCGLAMYLPAYPDYKRDIYHGTKFLDGYYKENIAWNQATSLVE